jgi:hypothetical protein
MIPANLVMRQSRQHAWLQDVLVYVSVINHETYQRRWRSNLTRLCEGNLFREHLAPSPPSTQQYIFGGSTVPYCCVKRELWAKDMYQPILTRRGDLVRKCWCSRSGILSAFRRAMFDLLTDDSRPRNWLPNYCITSHSPVRKRQREKQTKSQHPCPIILHVLIMTLCQYVYIFVFAYVWGRHDNLHQLTSFVPEGYSSDNNIFTIFIT